MHAMETTTASINSVLKHLTLKRAELAGRLKEIETVIALLSATDNRSEKPRARATETSDRARSTTTVGRGRYSRSSERRSSNSWKPTRG